METTKNPTVFPVGSKLIPSSCCVSPAIESKVHAAARSIIIKINGGPKVPVVGVPGVSGSEEPVLSYALKYHFIAPVVF